MLRLYRLWKKYGVLEQLYNYSLITEFDIVFLLQAENIIFSRKELHTFIFNAILGAIPLRNEFWKDSMLRSRIIVHFTYSVADLPWADPSQ